MYQSDNILLRFCERVLAIALAYMPSGRSHDSITLWSLPFVAGTTWVQTQSSSLALIASGGFLFSGLMFGPDLDIYSRQYKRWGLFRWIWLPYRRMMRHRSVWSHGPVVGTLVRVAYLSLWLVLVWLGVGGLGAIAATLLQAPAELLVRDWLHSSTSTIGQSFQHHPLAWLTLLVGLELGALSHALADACEFAYKRWLKCRTRRSRQPTQLRRSLDPISPTISEPPQVELPPIPPVPIRRDSQFPP